MVQSHIELKREMSSARDAAKFVVLKPSFMLEHQSKYTEEQLDTQDRCLGSQIFPINFKNISRHHVHQTNLMNKGKEITDIAKQHDQMVKRIAGRQLNEEELLLNAERLQRRYEQHHGKGVECPVCLKKGVQKLYKSEHAYQFHLRRRHPPHCLNCQLRLAEWGDYATHLPYCNRKFQRRLKPGLERRLSYRSNQQ